MDKGWGDGHGMIDCELLKTWLQIMLSEKVELANPTPNNWGKALMIMLTWFFFFFLLNDDSNQINM